MINVMKSKLQPILEEFNKTISKKRKHELRLVLADNYYVSGDFEESLRYFCSYLEECESLGQRSEMLVTHRRIGDCLLQLSRLDESLSHYQSYLKLAMTTGNRVEEQRAYHTIGEAYFEKFEGEERDSVRAKLLKLSELAYVKSYRVWESLSEAGVADERELKEMLCCNMLNRGLIDMERENLDAAKKKLVTCYVEARKLNLEVQLTALLMLATLKTKRGCLQDALTLLKQARRMSLTGDDERKVREKQFEILVCGARFRKAAKVMRAAARRSSADRQRFLELARGAVKAMTVFRRLAEAEDGQKKVKDLEKMGDFFANHRLYERAIDSYQEMLTCARALSSDRMKATAHSCLAVTNSDLRRFEEAIYHAGMEVETRSKGGAYDPDELAKSHLSMARYCYSLDRFEEALREIRKAKGIADQLQKPKLQIQCLEEEINNTELLEKRSEAEISHLRSKLDYLISTVGDDSDTAQESERTERESDEEGEEGSEEDCGELDDLSSDSSDPDTKEDEEKEEVVPGVALRKGSRKTAGVTRRNEKGETPLHRACVDGRLATVRELLETRAHPLNVEDHAGWTPLHDAANCGHLEIVRLLLEHGADLEHTGCPEERNTPLLSAGEGGSLDVVTFLITEKGANVWHKNVDGANIMDIIDDCRDRSIANDTFDTEAATNYRAFTGMLRRHLGEEKYVEFLRSRRGRRPQPEVTRQPLKSSNQEAPRKAKPRAQEEGVSDYITSMRMVGGSSSRLTLKPPEAEAPRREKGYVLDDDWLEEDAPTRRSRKRRSSLSERPRSRRTCVSATDSSSSEEEPAKLPRRETAREAVGPPREPPKVSTPRARSPVSPPPRPASPPSSDFSLPSTTASGLSSAPPRAVRLLFRQLSFLVPLRERSLTVGWLLREFRARCAAVVAEAPALDSLVLRSADGDFLAAETDRLAEVLSGEVARVSVLSREEAAVEAAVEREAGAGRPAVCVRGVKLAAVNAAALGGLSDQAVEQLELSGNGLDDRALAALARPLAAWSHCLTRLCLARNCLSRPAVDLLAELSPPPRGVAVLSLAYNHLTNDAVPALTHLIARWPALKEVDLTQCMLTEEATVNHADAWRAAFEASVLEILNLSSNALENKGVDSLLRAMEGECRVHTLFLRACIVYSDGSSVAAYLRHHLDHSRAAPLLSLDLGANRLGAGSLDTLSALLRADTCRLTALRIDGNRALVAAPGAAGRLLHACSQAGLEQVEMDAPGGREAAPLCDLLFGLLLQEKTLSRLLLRRCVFARAVVATVVRANDANPSAVFVCDRTKDCSVVVSRGQY